MSRREEIEAAGGEAAAPVPQLIGSLGPFHRRYLRVIGGPDPAAQHWRTRTDIQAGLRGEGYDVPLGRITHKVAIMAGLGLAERRPVPNERHPKLVYYRLSPLGVQAAAYWAERDAEADTRDLVRRAYDAEEDQ